MPCTCRPTPPLLLILNHPSYGTFDHLMLLMGRLVSFASRDMARKRKARQAEAMAAARNNRGGAPPGSMPPPGSGGPPPGGPPGGPPGAPPMGPMFPGLLPSTGKFQLPKGFSPPPTSPGPATAYDSDDSDDVDGPAYNLDESTAAAAREWDALRTAFEVFRNRLGPDFAPLDADADSEPTPFGGPALTYRTFSIAGIWMNFYMGLIVLYRCLPSMPPVAMAAAGLQAAQTAPWAREIARIAAGLGEDLNNQAAVSMSVGAACIEAGFCLFVAGVQVRFLSPSTRACKVVADTFSCHLVPRGRPAALARPAAAPHLAADGVAVGAADRRRVRVGVDQGGAAGARAAVRDAARPGAAVPGLDMDAAAAHRQADPGSGGARGPPGAGADGAGALCAGTAGGRAGSG